MKTSARGIKLIKGFEGCRLVAYKPVAAEKYWTIGYGHYGADVKKGMTITQAKADELLKQDLVKFELKVEKYNPKYHFNQNQFDALVSFALNVGNIDGLTAKGTRSIAQISEKFLAYNKGSGKVLAGLARRRAEEKKLFDTPMAASKASAYTYNGVDYSPVFNPVYYANKHADVKKAYGTDAKKLFDHFVKFGMREGRQAILDFNVQVYKERYMDLKNNFGQDLSRYFKHYCEFGKSEGRKGI